MSILPFLVPVLHRGHDRPTPGAVPRRCAVDVRPHRRRAHRSSSPTHERRRCRCTCRPSTARASRAPTSTSAPQADDARLTLRSCADAAYGGGGQRRSRSSDSKHGDTVVGADRRTRRPRSDADEQVKRSPCEARRGEHPPACKADDVRSTRACTRQRSNRPRACTSPSVVACAQRHRRHPAGARRSAVGVRDPGASTYVGTTDTVRRFARPTSLPRPTSPPPAARSTRSRRSTPAPPTWSARGPADRCCAAPPGPAPPTCLGVTLCARRGGVVTVTGGKLTTYRRMAVGAIDAASHSCRGRWAEPHPHLRLAGGEGSTRRRPCSTSPGPTRTRHRREHLSRTATAPARRRSSTRRHAPLGERTARPWASLSPGGGGLRSATRDGSQPRRRVGAPARALILDRAATIAARAGRRRCSPEFGWSDPDHRRGSSIRHPGRGQADVVRRLVATVPRSS